MKFGKIVSTFAIIVGLASPAFAGSTATVTGSSNVSTSASGHGNGGAIALAGSQTAAFAGPSGVQTTVLTTAGGTGFGHNSWNANASGTATGSFHSLSFH